jgi:glutamyl-tRNA reductase
VSVLAVGLSHRSSGVETLERVAINSESLPKLHADLLDCADVSESMAVSTCNRLEVYAVVDSFHGALAEITAALARQTGIPQEELTGHLYVHYAAAAVQHLFTVAAGMDSMVYGEAQILGQVRSAYAAARASGTVGPALHELAQQALRVGKRVRSETAIEDAGASVVSEALADAEEVLGGLTGARCVLVGAGSMAGLAAAHLARAGVAAVTIANRTRASAERLAGNVRSGGVAADVAELGSSGLSAGIGAADLVVTCTGASDVVLGEDTLAAAVIARAGPLVICDLGLPRDVAPQAAQLAGVHVVDLTSLRARLAENGLGADVAGPEQLVADEVAEYLAGQRSAAVTPTVTALRKRAAEMVDAELLRMDARLPELDPRTRAELSKTVRRVVDKLLHTPTVRVKELSRSPEGADYADALRELFALDPTSPLAVAAAAEPRIPEEGDTA